MNKQAKRHFIGSVLLIVVAIAALVLPRTIARWLYPLIGKDAFAVWMFLVATLWGLWSFIVVELLNME